MSDDMDLLFAIGKGGSGKFGGEDDKIRPIRPLAGCGHFAHKHPVIHVGGERWGMTCCSEACAKQWESRLASPTETPSVRLSGQGSGEKP